MEYTSVSKSDDPSGIGGVGLCSGCGISLKVTYLQHVMTLS